MAGTAKDTPDRQHVSFLMPVDGAIHEPCSVPSDVQATTNNALLCEGNMHFWGPNI